MLVVVNNFTSLTWRKNLLREAVVSVMESTYKKAPLHGSKRAFGYCFFVFTSRIFSYLGEPDGVGDIVLAVMSADFCIFRMLF